MAALVNVETRDDGVAVVRLDDPAAKLNTFSRPAINELERAFDQIQAAEGVGVVVCGKRGGGLGAGANIGELLSFTDADLRGLIGDGHRLLNRIEDFPRPVVASIGNLALGGILELALAPAARVADAGAQLGFPEINLLLFPGLFGGVRAARRMGLGDAAQPDGPGAIPMVLSGKSISADAALAAGLIEDVVPAGSDPIDVAARLVLDLASGRRQRRADRTFTRAEVQAVAAAFRPGLEKATRGRGRPRAGFVFLDTLPDTLTLSREEAQRVEMEAFCGLTLSREGKAGMRHFFVNTAAAKPPKSIADAKPRPARSVGVAGVDGYMGNAIAWLALANARLEVVGWTDASVPNLKTTGEQRLDIAREGLLAKYGALIKKGSVSEEAARAAIGRVRFTTELAELARCDVVIEAIAENPAIKQAFYEKLGALVSPDTIVASNSSSMGPGFLVESFERGGGKAERFINLHFFSPAELPAMALVELILGEKSSKESAVTAFSLARSMKKTPVVLLDGSRGFLINAILAEFIRSCEAMLHDGVPIDRLDAVLTAAGMPQGFGVLMDAVGIDTVDGMMRFMGQEHTLARRLVEAGRLGRKSSGGFYDYEAPGPRSASKGVWPGLAGLLAAKPREVSDAEMVERPFRAMYEKASELLARGIVDSKETADLAMILGLGLPVYLGGIFYEAQGRGWDR